MRIIDKIVKGKKKVDKFNDERRRAKRNTPLPLMILNDGIALFVVIAYVLMGVLANLWHPGWLVFMVIPVYYMTVSCVVHKDPYLFPVPFLVVGAYLLIGFLGQMYKVPNGLWHPYWILFFIIPLYYMTVAAIKGGRIAKIFDFIVPVLVIGIYLILGLVVGAWHPGWVVFFAIPLYYQIGASYRRYQRRQKERSGWDDDDDDSVDGEVR